MVEFGVLGALQVRTDHGPVSVSGRLRRALLLRLLVSPNRGISAEQLADDLWEGSPPPSWPSTLQSHVSLLRRVIGADRIEGRSGRYVLRVEDGELDAEVFAAEAADGRRLFEAGDPVRAEAVLGRALGRWRGAAFADVNRAMWAVPEVSRLEEMRLATLEVWFEARLDLGEHHELASAVSAAVAEHPLRERLWAQLMLAEYRSGRQADALRTYQRLRTHLAEEVGLEPSAELVALDAAIAAGDPGLDRAAGRERRAGPVGSPVPPAVLDRSRTNLARPATSFVGRAREQRELEASLGPGRLVTVTGPGGVGKTRLAVHVATAALERGEEAVWMVDLSAVVEPELVVPAVAAALHVSGDLPVVGIGALVDAVADRRFLLLLDNCEQVVDAVAKVADSFMANCPGVGILATSREPIAVAGEQVYRLAPLGLPDAGGDELGSVLRSDAVQLLAERAARHGPFVVDEGNGAAVASICRRLDGLPLALELAAGRLAGLSAADLDERIDRSSRLLVAGRAAAPRQASLDAVLDWSWDLLVPSERTVLTAMLAFAGSFDLAAAEAVCGGGAVDPDEVAGLVAGLVDKSLVQADHVGSAVRYRLLETVRRSVASHRDDGGDAELARAAHARWFLERAEAATAQFRGSEPDRALRTFDADYPNFRAAVEFAVGAAGQAELALRLVVALHRYWYTSGRSKEGIELFERALGRPDAQAPTALRSEALRWLGDLYTTLGDWSAARARLEGALAVARRLDDDALAAPALTWLAQVASRQGATDEAARLADEAVDVARASGDPRLRANAVAGRALALAYDGDVEGAARDLTEALADYRLVGDRLSEALMLNNLATLELADGRYVEARAHFAAALVIRGELGGDHPGAVQLYGLAMASGLLGDTAEATETFDAALRAAVGAGEEWMVGYCLLGLALMAGAGGNAAGAVGTVAAARHAAVLHGAAAAVFERTGETMEPLEAGLHQWELARLRAAVGPAEIDAAYEVGRAMSTERAVELARTDPPR